MYCRSYTSRFLYILMVQKHHDTPNQYDSYSCCWYYNRQSGKLWIYILSHILSTTIQLVGLFMPFVEVVSSYEKNNKTDIKINLPNI